MNQHVLKRPIVTEKSLLLANTNNTFTFEVDRQASKLQIKELVEQLFGVKVVSVNTIMSNRDTKRTGRKRLASRVGKIKKALVKLKAGDTIPLFDVYKSDTK